MRNALFACSEIFGVGNRTLADRIISTLLASETNAINETIEKGTRAAAELIHYIECLGDSWFPRRRFRTVELLATERVGRPSRYGAAGASIAMRRPLRTQATARASLAAVHPRRSA